MVVICKCGATGLQIHALHSVQLLFAINWSVITGKKKCHTKQHSRKKVNYMRDFSTDARANVNQHAAKKLQWKITNTNAHILHAVNFQISHQCKLPDVNFIGQYT